MPPTFGVTPGLCPFIQPLTLAITTPADSTMVRIKIVELAHWHTDAGDVVEEGYAYDSIRAEFEGTLANGVFTTTKTTHYYYAEKPLGPDVRYMTTSGDPPPDGFVDRSCILYTLDLDITGPGSKAKTSVKAPLQCWAGRLERGYWELGFEVSADIGGTLQTETMRSPISIRQLLKKRAELAFIAAAPSDFGQTSYATYAKQYWTPLVDNMAPVILDLETILNTIIALPPDRRFNEPLGQVNIICHGNEFTAWLRKTKAETDQIDGITKGVLPIVGFPIPDASVLDEESLVVLWGCNVGDDQTLMNEFRQQFGDLATFLAPKYENQYVMESGAISKRFAEEWLAYKATAGGGRIADEEFATLIEAKYTGPNAPHPRYKSWGHDKWVAIAKLPRDTWKRHSTAVGATGIPDSSVYDTDDTGKRTLKSGSALFDAVAPDVPDIGTIDKSEFEWVAKVTAEPKVSDAEQTYSVELMGWKTGNDTTRPLTVNLDGTGTPIQPDLQNPDHFGSAP
jgi:hypothetical protein